MWVYVWSQMLTSSFLSISHRRSTRCWLVLTADDFLPWFWLRRRNPAGKSDLRSRRSAFSRLGEEHQNPNDSSTALHRNTGQSLLALQHDVLVRPSDFQVITILPERSVSLVSAIPDRARTDFPACAAAKRQAEQGNFSAFEKLPWHTQSPRQS